MSNCRCVVSRNEKRDQRAKVDASRVREGAEGAADQVSEQIMEVAAQLIVFRETDTMDLESFPSGDRIGADRTVISSG